MAITLHLHHDKHYDLVNAEDAKGMKSTGQFDVETRNGTEVRERVQFEAPQGLTTIELPDDYEASPQALLHLVQTLTERHSAEDDIYAVSGENDNIVARLAALLNAEVRPFEAEVTATSKPRKPKES